LLNFKKDRYMETNVQRKKISASKTRTVNFLFWLILAGLFSSCGNEKQYLKVVQVNTVVHSQKPCSIDGSEPTICFFEYYLDVCNNSQDTMIWYKKDFNDNVSGQTFKNDNHDTFFMDSVIIPPHSIESFNYISKVSFLYKDRVDDDNMKEFSKWSHEKADSVVLTYQNKRVAKSNKYSYAGQEEVCY